MGSGPANGLGQCLHIRARGSQLDAEARVGSSTAGPEAQARAPAPASMPGPDGSPRLKPVKASGTAYQRHVRPQQPDSRLLAQSKPGTGMVGLPTGRDGDPSSADRDGALVLVSGQNRGRSARTV